NHEEVIKALEEGIGFAENLNPVEAIPDARGALSSMIFTRDHGAEGHATVTLPARTALVAAGTAPHTPRAKEAPRAFALDAKKKCFQPHSASRGADGRWQLSADPQGFFTSYNANGKFVTYYGDNHPRYAGNVVKAMASAKDGYPKIAALFARELAALD